MNQMKFKAFGNSDKYTNAPITDKNINEVKDFLNNSKSNKYTYHEWLTYESDIKPFYDIDFNCDNINDINNWSDPIMNQAKDILTSLYPDSSGIAICSSHGFKPDKNKHTVSYHMVVLGYNTKMEDLEKFNKMNNLYDININNTNHKLFDKSIYTNGRNFRSIYNYKPSDRGRQKIPVNIQFNPEYHIIQSNDQTNPNSKKLIVDGTIESNNIIQEGEPIECAKCSKEELIKYIDNTKIIQRLSDYNDWLTLGMICYNNFDGDDEGFNIWNKYSKEDDKYEGKIKLRQKYNSFNNERERLVSYKRLLQWNVEDFPCKNEYEQHYKMGRLIEFMNERHAYYEPACEYFTFDGNGFMRQKENAFKTSMLNKNFMIDDKEINPYKIWITSQDRRDIRELVFDPSNNIKPGQYNIWRGFDYANTGNCDMSKVQHVLDHIYNIWANGNESTYNYIIGWFAKMIQTPWDKNGICLVLKSIPGVGKTTIVDLFNKIIGKKYSISLSNLKLILGDFNGDAEGKILVNFNETGMWYDKKMSGAFKEFITDEYITINEKNVKSYTIRNFANCIITTNEDHIVGVSAKDRRFNVIECSDKLYDDDYYNKLRDTDIQELANYFYNVDISKYNPRKYERSELFKEQQELSFNSVESFVKDMIEGEVYSEWHDEDAIIEWSDKQELYDRYTDNCKGTHCKTEIKNVFWRYIRQYIPIEFKQITNGKRLYKLCEYEEAVEAWDKYLSRY
jgi:hypothetical protein